MIISTKEQYKEALEEILSVDDVVALDIEADMFTKEKFLATDLSLEGVGFYAGRDCKGYILAGLMESDFQKVFDTKTVLFHNAKFDLKVFEKYNYDISKVDYHDTMIMAWLVDENRYSFALKNLAASVLNVQTDKITKFKDLDEKPKKEDFENPKEFIQILKLWIKEMGMYCIDDCKYTYKLYKKFRPKLEKDGLWYEYTSLELPFCTVLREMESRGIKVDTEYLNALGGRLEGSLLELETDIYKEIGYVLDINSPKQLREYFFEKKGYTLPDDYRTPKGALSTNVASLKYLAKEKEDKASQLILKFRELGKLNSTYVKGMLGLTRDGIIRAGFRQTGTKTGRLSSSKPNLQNIPRRDDEWNIRKAFIAREGYTFVIADYSQIELRLMAWFCKDETLVKTYQDGGDIHQATADAVGCERIHAKAINFGINYGMGAFGLAGNLGVSIKEAQKFIDDYFRKFPRVKLFAEQAKNTVRKRYVVHTITGRKRRFTGYPAAKRAKDWKKVASFERQAVNSIVQGCLSGDTEILVRGEGLVRMQDMAGRNLTLWDGNEWVKGKCVYSGFKKKVEITFKEGKTIVCSPEHKFLTVDKKGDTTWKKASKLKATLLKKDRIKTTNPVSDWDYLKGSLDKKFAHLASQHEKGLFGIVLWRLGYFGRVVKRKKIIMSFEKDEVFLLNAVRAIFDGYKFKITNVNLRGKDVQSIHIQDKELAILCEELLLEKNLSKYLFKNSDILRNYLLALFVDTRQKQGFPKRCIHILRMHDIKKGLELLGIKSYTKKGIFSDNFHVKENCIYSLRDKNELVEEDRFNVIKKIKVTEEEVRMYDIVDTDNQQFMANGLVVHNSASDILKIAMRNLHEKLKPYNAHILVQIHDELLIEVPKEKAEEVSKMVKYEMENAVDLKYVPLITEPSISDCWIK